MTVARIAILVASVSCGCNTGPATPVPGPANLTLACRPANPTCDHPGYNMAVLGDRVELCETQAAGTAIRLQLRSSNDPHDLIVVAFDGYRGPGTYALDSPNSRYLSVDDDVSFAQCMGGPINVGKHVTAADPNCGSPSCSVIVSDPSPAAPFPKPLTFTVHCTSLCENGSDVTCPGPIDFVTRANCT